MTFNFRLKLKGGAGERAAANHLPQPPTADTIRSYEIEVEHSMMKVLDLLSPETNHEAAMIALGASSATFVEPLSKHEVQVLACALYMEKRTKPLVYYDVLELTDFFSGKAMNLAMVYRTIDRLKERGMLIEDDNVYDDGDRSRRFKIHGNGREAFRMAILNSKVLANTKRHAAA